MAPNIQGNPVYRGGYQNDFL